MWKKTQTFYIIVSTLLTTAMFFCSFATIIGPDGYELKIMYYEKLPYLTMLIMLLTPPAQPAIISDSSALSIFIILVALTRL